MTFSACETGLFWKCLPDKTSLKGEKCSGSKRSKDRITVLVCSNMSGSEKLLHWLLASLQNLGVSKMLAAYLFSMKLTRGHGWLVIFLVPG